MSFSNRHFPSPAMARAFESGFDHKMVEINEMGFAASCDKFNMDFPPGQPFPSDISEGGQWFAKGEFEALTRAAK